MNNRATDIQPWGSSLDKLKEWDPEGGERLLRMETNPWNSGVFLRKEVELISLALHCSSTNLNEAGTLRHIRAALEAGATRDEVPFVLQSGALPAPSSPRVEWTRRGTNGSPERLRPLASWSMSGLPNGPHQ